jgi:hypothetical protein
MIVYGEPQYTAPANSFLAALRSRLSGSNPDSLEELRSLLIQAGLLEQALRDHRETSAISKCLRQQAAQLTDAAAMAFHLVWARLNPFPRAVAEGEAAAWLGKMSLVLQQLDVPRDLSLTIRIPAGFELHAVFPEQYCAAAAAWCEKRAGMWPKRATVIGLRGIGTPLSAVIGATLHARGWDVLRCTVRPVGPPSAREVELSECHLDETICGIVVNDGPGTSGSSMAAVARALAIAGVPDISFFPGHGGGPGPAASAEIQKRWVKTPRYATPLTELKWNGRTLPELLAGKSREFHGGSAPFEVFDDLSAGRWRRFAFANETEWPAATARFERTKFRCADRNGNAVLWKFAGFHGPQDAELAFIRMQHRAQELSVPEPLGIFHGFVAMPWIEGRRLVRADGRKPAVLAHIGRHLLAAAQPPLEPADAQVALLGASEMLYWNTKAAFGDAAAEGMRPWMEAAEQNEIPFSYGDGQMEPHQWIRTPAGELFKIDCTRNGGERTIIGRQSLLWDVAGALIEWDLDPHAAGPLLAPILDHGIRIDPQALAFYQAAYAAHRLGLVHASLEHPGSAAEKGRLMDACDFYRNKLQELVEAVSVKHCHRREEAFTR